jgi:hypothetical protein
VTSPSSEAAAERGQLRLWTKRDVADYLGVNVRTVERLSIPRVPITVTGRRPIVRFDPKQVMEWVDARRTRKLRAS